MARQFEELDYQDTPIGMLSLRRRHDPIVGKELFEIKLGDEFLMTSLFTASEIALADLALAKCDGSVLDVVVGGLGLGYTAQAALRFQTVRSLLVVEFLPAVIEWHEKELLPLGAELSADPRCRFREGDFFALMASQEGFDDGQTARRFDAILLDIDHTPEALLDERSEGFYQEAGLNRLLQHLKPGGMFALWSNSRPDDAFTDRLSRVFPEAWSEPVVFDNPYQSTPTTQAVYLARAAR